MFSGNVLRATKATRGDNVAIRTPDMLYAVRCGMLVIRLNIYRSAQPYIEQPSPGLYSSPLTTNPENQFSPDEVKKRSHL